MAKAEGPTPLEIRSWAERLLLGDTLADKLYTPAALSDDRPGAPIPTPDRPGRPPGLWEEGKAKFPGALHDTVQRGRALHFFANHELLAIELFALALLRFPDADPGFRRGTAAIIAEEQKHLGAYLSRMGPVAFGDLPTPRFFWTTLAPARDLPAFVAGMSLTFEQANLDFAGWYADAFRAVGDTETADLLETVLSEEIGHVKHGVTWFRRWCPGPLWDRWTDALPPPLTPARARGPHFRRADHAAAGIDVATLDRLAVYGASKGRPPAVFLFDPHVESDVAGLPTVKASHAVSRGLATVPMFLAGIDDVVLVDRMPAAPFLASLKATGFDLPEFAATVAGRRLGRLQPWGWSPRTLARLRTAGVAPEHLPTLDPVHLRTVYAKSWLATRLPTLLATLDDPLLDRLPSVVLTDPGALADLPDGTALKAPYGTAGRGLRRHPAPAWAADILRTQGALVVEPWCDRVADLSIQFDTHTGRVERWGRFLAGPHGRYLGAVLGRWHDGLDPDVRRALAPIQPTLEALVRALLPLLPDVGHAGLDLFLHRTPDGLRLRVAELNPRMTMGRIAQAVERRVSRGRVGIWRIVTRREVGDLDAWAAALRTAHPVRTRGTPPVIEAGALFTTDPTHAEVTSVLVVAESLAEAEAMLPPGHRGSPPR